jgi:TolB-like protein/Flp pilus assembly protein TadD
VVVLVIGALGLAVWNYLLKKPTQQIERASIERMAYPLPDKPSIAVLAFNNMSDDPNQEYFCDGITEEIITGLSKLAELFVIARNSSFTYKGKPVKVQQVAQDLGVRYVLEGSVRKSGEKLRVTAQLIDAIKGHHLWADRWDRELKDVFAIQDEITMKIITSLQVKLTRGEQARVVAKGSSNLDAYLKVLEANEKVALFNQENNTLARRLAQEAIALDPDYAFAYTILGKTHMLDVWLGTTPSPKKSIGRAIQLAQQAIAIDESHGRARGLLGFLYTMAGKSEMGIMEAEKAIALEPNSDLGHQYLGLALRFGGRPKEAIPVIKKAIRLNPSAPGTYLFNLGLSYLFSGNHEEAISECKKATSREPNNLGAQIALTVANGMSGRDEEARAAALEVLRINPKFSLEGFSKSLVYKNRADKERYIEALRQAGLPETPPLPLPDKPSIAVLPFVNMSDDPKQEYFTDGMTEDLITDLSKISGLFVIARNSSFRYKGKSVDVKRISLDLGVRYVLEGSMRRVRDKIRINAQLIDATTGGHLWADRYDGILGDVFSLQDKITARIVAALAIKLTADEKATISQMETKNFQAYDTFLQGWAHYVRFGPAHFFKAIPYFEKAVQLDSHYGRAYAALASIYWESFYRFWHASLGVEWQVTKEKADAYLKKAMMNPTPLGYLVASKMLISRFKHEEATARAEKAIALDPNDANGYIAKAYTFIFSGRPKESLDFIRKAMRIDPQYPAYYLFVLGLANFGMERYEEAATSFERALKRNPENYVALIPLVAAYAHLNREQDATAMIEKLNKVMPMVTMGFVRGCPLWRYKHPRDKRRLLTGLKKAGLPSSIYEKLRKAG